MTTALAVNTQNELNPRVTELIDKGYCPFPLPAGAKSPPRRGITGAVPNHTAETIWEWWDGLDNQEMNIGLRLQTVLGSEPAMEVIALDIDDYCKPDDKPDAVLGYEGFMQFASEAGLSRAEAENALDSTVRITRREPTNPGGHYLFRVPAGRKWARSAGARVDVLQYGHRYSLAPGSTVDGMAYTALDGRSKRPKEIPAANTLPMLPEALQAALKPGARSGSVEPLRGSNEELQEWLEDKTFEPLAKLNETMPMGKIYAKRVKELEEKGTGSRHDVVTNTFYEMFSAAVTDGYEGCLTAAISFQEKVRQTYEASGESHRVPKEANQLWERVEKVRGEVEAGDRRCARTLSEQVDLSGFRLTPTKEDPESNAVSVSDGLDSPEGMNAQAEQLEGLNPGNFQAYLTGALPVAHPGLAYVPGNEIAEPIALLYPGKYHEIHARPEHGKSAFAQWVCAQVVNNPEAGHVVYLDFESDQVETFKRLIDAGVDTEQAVERFHYYAPEFHLPDQPRAWEQVFAHERIDLVVLDGFNVAMSFVGGSSSDQESDVNRFLSELPKRIMRDYGAAVFVVDHMPKDSNSDIRFPVGSGAKLAAIDGVSFTTRRKDAKKARAGAQRNVYEVLVVKDRHNRVKSRGAMDGNEAGVFGIADLVYSTSPSDAGEEVTESQSRIEVLSFDAALQPMKFTLKNFTRPSLEALAQTRGLTHPEAMLALVYARGGQDGLTRDEASKEWKSEHSGDNARMGGRNFDRLKEQGLIVPRRKSSRTYVVPEETAQAKGDAWWAVVNDYQATEAQG